MGSITAIAATQLQPVSSSNTLQQERTVSGIPRYHSRSSKTTLDRFEMSYRDRLISLRQEVIYFLRRWREAEANDDAAEQERDERIREQMEHDNKQFWDLVTDMQQDLLREAESLLAVRDLLHPAMQDTLDELHERILEYDE